MVLLVHLLKFIPTRHMAYTYGDGSFPKHYHYLQDISQITGVATVRCQLFPWVISLPFNTEA